MKMLAVLGLGFVLGAAFVRTFWTAGESPKRLPNVRPCDLVADQRWRWN